MSRTSSPRESTLLHLDIVSNNLFVEIDTTDGYEYQRVFDYCLNKGGTLSAIVADTKQDANGFRYLPIAKSSGMGRNA